MKKIIIGLDIDSTINNFNELLVDKFKKITGEKDFSVDNLIYWDLPKVLLETYNGKYPVKTLNNIYMSEVFTYELELLDGVLDILNEAMKNDNVEVILVTAIHDSLINTRDKWIKDKIGLDLKVFYECNKEKIKMDYLIDDALHNLDSLAPIIGTDNCICIAQKYNEKSSYKRVSHIRDAFDYIYKKENLK